MDTQSNKKKRTRSSEGETPKPDCKQTKMAMGENITDLNDLKQTVLAIASSVKEIKDGQDSLKRMFESKIDKLRKDVLSTIDDKIKALKTDIDIDMAGESSHIDTLVKSLDTLSVRINNVESAVQNVMVDDYDNNGQRQNAQLGTGGRRFEQFNENEISVIIKNVSYTVDEDIVEKARNIIDCIDEPIDSTVKIKTFFGVFVINLDLLKEAFKTRYKRSAFYEMNIN